MKPVMQEFQQNVETGVQGDCHRACIASILELPISDVPHFYEDDPLDHIGKRRVQDFLATQGCVEVDFLFFPSEGLDECLDWMGKVNQDVYYILGGMSKNSVGHSVICLNNKIVHDPNGAGIVGPFRNGQYSITILASLKIKHTNC